MTIKTEKPLDHSGQVWRGIDDKFPKRIHNATTTSDGLMSAEDKAKLDSIDANGYNRIYDIATWESDGLMSKDDKKKMDGIEENANNYIHPNTPEIRHVTDEQITYWNAKASTSVVTQQTNGLMSSIDKIKLDGIEEKANNYIHPNTPEIRHVTDKQIDFWNNKASTDVATQNKDGLMSFEDKRKFDSIEENANNYIHPNNEGIRHVSDDEKDYWNSKADKTLVTNSENGLMAAVDKVKLDSIEEGANNYTHPEGPDYRHVTDEQIKFWDSKGSNSVVTLEKDGLMAASDKQKLEKLYAIDTDMVDKHYVTTEEKELWNTKSGVTIATTDKNGLMTSEDKKKLDSIEEGANNYIHPGGSEYNHVSDEQIRIWSSKADNVLADQDKNGLLSNSDKIKLDSIEEGANNYTHPESHSATMIVEDSTHRFVTDEEKEEWSNKASTDLATQDNAGLMSAEDKAKLDNIEDLDIDYIHPETHPATMIEQDSTHRFVTDEEKEFWSNHYVHPVTHPATMIDQDSFHRFVTDEEKEFWSSSNNYEHPETHPATMIEQDSTHRFVTDAQIIKWNSGTGSGGVEIEDIPLATEEQSGLMSAEDKKKLNNIEDNISSYEHPETHPATMIEQDSTHRFVTDEEKAKLNSITIPQTDELSLIYSEWSDQAPYTQVLTVNGIDTSTNAYIGINPSATVEQMTVASEAQIKVQSVEQDKIIIVANGTKPTIDLPIIIMTGSNIMVFEINNYDAKEYLSEPPNEGNHYINEIIYSSKPVESGCIGWVCIETGEPGIWKPFGVIDL